MKILKYLITIFVFFSTNSKAFDFNSTDSAYDFTQTVQILVVDKQGSKLFGMFDPFEMKVTTIPSRFYITVLGVIDRGHKNGEGVTLINGPVDNYVYVVIFRSISSSHFLLIGDKWLVDGNKKIYLSAEEVSLIYELLKGRADNTPADDLKKWEPLFKEMNDHQAGAVDIEAEMKSIAESRKAIEDRLPDGYDDVKNLPYYDKASENEKFRENLEKLKKSQKIESITPQKTPSKGEFKQNLSFSSSAEVPRHNQTFSKLETYTDMDIIMIILGIVIVAGCIIWLLRKSKRG